MKKTIFYLFALMFVGLNASAQDAFYYYRGEKVPLKVVEGKVAAKLASNSSLFMPCYTDDQGLEVWPTGYVSVKLKSADDVALLQNVAHENGLEVVEQDPFMPPLVAAPMQ